MIWVHVDIVLSLPQISLDYSRIVCIDFYRLFKLRTLTAEGEELREKTQNGK
jgi:hypothetical protein